MPFDQLTVPELTESLGEHKYIADRGLSTALLLALKLGKPLLLEGEVGVGKTELARTVSTMLGRELIRLQCYEGIDMHQALYEWDYARQMLFVRSLGSEEASDDQLFGPRFLLERPLLQAVRAGDQCVLLIDEVDRADDEFEAFLLELLGDYQVTIPEVGTIKAQSRPIVILTSNRTRELHDALKRRCLYTWIGFPESDREVEIVRSRLPEVGGALANQVVGAVNRLRAMDLEKLPGVAETIDWTESVSALGSNSLTAEIALDTLGAVVKDRDDLEYASRNIQDVIS
ncbi:MAG: MoxR family ATPase [Candidatus Nanopelagicales bacterium]|nr:MoxR family ATPase [Actinomycetota bacterium]MBT5183097.1 MoxR family ATPase [Actinomycetota bacterium]MBT5502091.1 MoxR family ATPase [Actinomycetota bacterium]MBT5806225.1 MoxR family ATPase [Actinomycetota bacterium]NCG03487.1 AAA domain-containing protein [Actinomycetales bacterium]